MECDCYCYCKIDPSEDYGGDGSLCGPCIDGLHVPEDYDLDEDSFE